MSAWSDLANKNPFKAVEEKPNVETSLSEDVRIVDESAYTDRFVIATKDGRAIPVLVDNGTRSVYPIKSK